MSPLPQGRFLSSTSPDRLATSLPLSSTDVRSILSDALLSFSPLATLVGADSARALARRVTNSKQTYVVSLAPIGALGMMATVCKASNLEGLKEMLGAGDEDIYDAARELGCGTLYGTAALAMDKHGGMVTAMRGDDSSQTPCAIVRVDWETGKEKMNFNALQRVVTTFAQGMMSGRLRFYLRSEQDVNETLRMVQDIYSKVSSDADFDAFYALDKLEGGQGTVELHWPAPAMSLQTNALVIYLYGAFFIAGFFCTAFLSASALPSGLLLGGQCILILGHVLAQYIVKSQREILRVAIPKTCLGTHWMLIDKPRFSSVLARRPYVHSNFPRNHITLSQSRKFKRKYAPTWQVLATLVALAVGFIAFYVGGKSSSIRTVGIYIGLFVLANVTKGSVILYANKSYYTRLNNFGYKDAVWRHDTQTTQVQDPEVEEVKSPELSSKIPPGPDDGSTDWSRAFPDGFRIYSRYLVRGRDAREIFCFSKTDIWIAVARSIVRGHAGVHPQQGSDRSSALLQMPLYLWHPDENGGREEFHSLLILPLDKIKPDDLFYSVVMEIIMILTDNYNSQLLCSESPKTTDLSILAAVVYSVSRMLASDRVECGDVKFPVQVRGAMQLLQAAALLQNSINRSQHDEDLTVVSQLNAAAAAAFRASGATPRPSAQERLSKATARREEILEKARAARAAAGLASQNSTKELDGIRNEEPKT